MKKIAFYLPQFHTIPENDEWWGEGFTEWVNVKNSVPQFKNHIQPEVPLDKNYYCLLEDNIQRWQSDLAKEYGIDGFCYYHYWFEGKMLLEKPMEKMLANTEVTIPFCICWANETWARTWDGQEENVLIKQNYNENRAAWKKHFEYLLQFFLDDRYIKEKGKPLLLIYKPQLISNCKDMVTYWNELAVEAGLDGIYVGCQHPSAYDVPLEEMGMDFGVEFEPFFTVRELNHELNNKLKKITHYILKPKIFFRKVEHKLLKKPNIYDYDEIWKRIIKRVPLNENMMPGAFPSWDNTPRRSNTSDIFWGATPKKFKKYFHLQLEHANEEYQAEYIFINAWNEWAEGAHLEPDEHNKYGYLEALKED